MGYYAYKRRKFPEHFFVFLADLRERPGCDLISEGAGWRDSKEKRVFEGNIGQFDIWTSTHVSTDNVDGCLCKNPYGID